MNTVSGALNPFALMTDPQSVLAAIANSERLARLHSRVFRPLDKPLISHVDDGDDAAAFDELVDAAPNEDGSD